MAQPLRQEAPLRYERLSDPILVKRAKDGDAQALEALCERHAPRVEKLAGLPADQARVVVLKDALGFSFEEISEESGMPVGTTKCYAHRGRNRLRDRLGEVA